MRIGQSLRDSGSEGINIFMRDERLESALAWCKKNNIKSNRLKKFNRESKRKRFKEKRGKLLSKKAKKRIQS
ncbi:hypothetical protein ES705_26648 [subsurface metagenome]